MHFQNIKYLPHCIALIIYHNLTQFKLSRRTSGCAYIRCLKTLDWLTQELSPCNHSTQHQIKLDKFMFLKLTALLIIKSHRFILTLKMIQKHEIIKFIKNTTGRFFNLLCRGKLGATDKLINKNTFDKKNCFSDKNRSKNCNYLINFN